MNATEAKRIFDSNVKIRETADKITKAKKLEQEKASIDWMITEMLEKAIYTWIVISGYMEETYQYYRDEGFIVNAIPDLEGKYKLSLPEDLKTNDLPDSNQS